MKPYRIPKAEPNTEASMCQYLAYAQRKLSACRIDPTKEFCALSIIGIVSEDRTFTPVKPEKRGCPKLENEATNFLEKFSNMKVTKRDSERTYNLNNSGVFTVKQASKRKP